MSDLERAESILRTTFGFPGFRPGQEEVIQAVISGSDVLAVMPTGSGKSLCYQLPALLRDGVTVVVSPLIALMRNQVAALRAFGIPAASVNSSNHFEDNRAVLEQIARSELRLVYIAPERLARPETRDLLKRSRISLLAVDEAHCISQWGHDFRPEYMSIGTLRAELGGLQVLALTATADTATRGDILARLFPKKPRVFVHGFDRPNLRLAMRAKQSAHKQITAFVAEHHQESGIVYCNTRRETEELAADLRREGRRALAYHAGMDPALRSKNQDAFLQEDGAIVVATVAFGMGIDKPDVRFVCHAGLPKNIESYYQEIGRAGRDGLPADTLTLYGMDDIRLRRLQIEQSEAADEQKRVDRHRLNALISLCEAPRCRRQTLLAYFGETTEPCGNCDLCIDGVEVVDGTIAAQKALSAVVRTGERFGTEHLINILCGDVTEPIAKFGHDRLPTFGVGKEYRKTEWRSIFRQLYAAQIISLHITSYGRWTITPKGRRVLKGEARIELRKQVFGEGKPRRVRKTPPDMANVDSALFEALRSRRRELAQAQAVPAYVIFPDRSLAEMSCHKPSTLEQMAAMHGVGRAKLAQYGAVFLEVIRRHLDTE